MKLLLASLIAVLLLPGCQTTNLNGERHSAEKEKAAHRDAQAAFEALFGHPGPKSFRMDETAIGTFYAGRRLTQVRAGAKVPRAVFRPAMVRQGWREILIPSEYLSEIHLPSSVPKSIMTCYTGHVNGHRADLLWSDDAETAMIVLDY